MNEKWQQISITTQDRKRTHISFSFAQDTKYTRQKEKCEEWKILHMLNSQIANHISTLENGNLLFTNFFSQADLFS